MYRKVFYQKLSVAYAINIIVYKKIEIFSKIYDIVLNSVKYDYLKKDRS